MRSVTQMDTGAILRRQISFFDAPWSKPGDSVAIGQALDAIHQGAYADHIAELRELVAHDEWERYEALKSRLPSVTFGGTFAGERKAQNLSEYSAVTVIDLDDVGSSMGEVSEALGIDDYIFAFWRSPSGRGFKALAALELAGPNEPTTVALVHKEAFRRLAEHLRSSRTMTCDMTGSDVSRLCFFSSDEKLVLKTSARPFSIRDSVVVESQATGARPVARRLHLDEDTIEHGRLYDPSARNRPADRKKIASILKYLRKRELSITQTYEAWYRVALAIAKTFTFDVGEDYFLRLCRLDGPGHDEEKSRKLLRYCYMNAKGEIGLGSVIYFARERGYDGDKGSPEGGPQ